MSNVNEEVIEFDWLQLQKDMNEALPVESRKQKLYRKIRENPFVPIGCLATTAALCVGLWSFRNGNKKMSQYMMRSRIAAQSFTVFAMIAGVMMSASATNRKIENPP